MATGEMVEGQIVPEVNTEQSRFRDAPFFETASKTSVALGGAGGIGSWLTLFLSRIVRNVYLYDFDTVEKVNMAGQLFNRDDIGMSKVRAVANMANRYGNAQMNPMMETIDSNSDVPDAFVFSAFDNMNARKDLFSIWDENENGILFIDGRLLADQYEVYFVQKGQEEMYRDTLFSDDEVENVACTFKQTSHFAAICAARMVHGYTNFLSQEALYKMVFHVKEEGNLFLFESK